jgi:uncharacterized protein (TIGR02452 family)
MSKRSQRAAIAKDTVNILDRGTYVSFTGQNVSIAAALRTAVDGTRLYSHADAIECLVVTEPAQAPSDDIRIEVINATTLAASKALVDRDPSQRVVCLNFASAKNPGGGFLGGSQAQEESLARASGLYACLLAAPRYYDANRACGTCLYTDHMIYSPDVPVIRDDDGMLLETPYCVSMITAPAVNLGALVQNDRKERSRTEETMRRRIGRVLSVAVARGHRVIVLGAWGCGAFRNDPATVAPLFYEHLRPGASFHRLFQQVVFAVLDHSATEEIIGPFREQFANVTA